jgi:hypothetical protein
MNNRAENNITHPAISQRREISSTVAAGLVAAALALPSLADEVRFVLREGR